MTRTVKAPEVRRAEILAAAAGLFQTLGYGATSVDGIVRAAGVAKGTFYYYFRTKDEVLAALARQVVDQMAQVAMTVVANRQLGPIEKLRIVLSGQRQIRDQGADIVEALHAPENRQLHDLSNVEMVKVIGPILAMIVQEGRALGLFDVADPLSTVQFILSGSLFLFGEGVFGWTKDEHDARTIAMVTLVERALRAPPGSFDGVLDDALADVLRP